jgi:hypothetical protein
MVLMLYQFLFQDFGIASASLLAAIGGGNGGMRLDMLNPDGCL